MIDVTKLPEAPWSAGMLAPGADPNTQDFFGFDVGSGTPTPSGDLFNRIWGKPERYGGTEGYSEPTQPWYFTDDPQSVYNPYYGFQDPNDIGRMYAQQGWQQTPEQFQSWGLQKNLTPPAVQAPSPPITPTEVQTPSSEFGGEQFTPQPGGGIDTGSPLGFQYPQEWDTASNVLTEFARGIPQQIPTEWTEGANIASQMGQGITAPTPQQWTTGTEYVNEMYNMGQTPSPWQWGTGSDVARQMAETGMPTSYEPWYQEAKSIVQRDTEKAIKQAAEQAGLTGLRWSTPLAQTAQRISGEQMANLGLAFTGQELGSLEAARQRQLQGVSQLQGLGAGEAGLTEAYRQRQQQNINQLQGFGAGQATLDEAALQRQLQGSAQLQGFGAGIAGLSQAEQQRGLQAASLLPGLGAQYLQAPQDWAAQTYGMGQGITQLGQTALDRYYQDFMRMAPENNPWVNQGMTYWGTPSQMGYQQYQPSTMSQIGQAAGGLGLLGLGIC